MKPQVYKELREHLDRLSLFAGRNPLVSSVAVLWHVMVVMFLWCVQEVAGLKEEGDRNWLVSIATVEQLTDSELRGWGGGMALS